MDDRKKILLLEDDTILAQTMKALLEQENYNVTLVEDGEEVLNATYEKNMISIFLILMFLC